MSMKHTKRKEYYNSIFVFKYVFAKDNLLRNKALQRSVQSTALFSSVLCSDFQYRLHSLNPIMQIYLINWKTHTHAANQMRFYHKV